ncbi:MAG: CopG family antitoxin [Chitinivibrionales bacterium]|nr:CopG family antitoxin [Chitinivibrionales bacterium]
MSAKNKSSVSKASNYKEMGEFWDIHDATDYLDDKKKVDVTIAIDHEITYCALDNQLSQLLQKVAKKHGVSSDTLVNIWLQEKLQEEKVC